MPQLKYVRVTDKFLVAEELGEFEIPANLKEFDLIVSSARITESEIEAFKSAAPEGCVVDVHRF